MKTLSRLFLSVLIVSMLLPVLPIVPVSAQEVVYLYHGFENADFKYTSTGDTTLTDRYTITPKTTAGGTDTGDFIWQTSAYTYTAGKRHPYYEYRAGGDSANPTAYIYGVSKDATPNMTMEMKDSSGIAHPSSGEGKLLYVDIRIKRTGEAENLNLKYLSSNGKTISQLIMRSNSSFRMNSDTAAAASTIPGYGEGSNTNTTPWLYYRTIIDFNTHTFEAFMGEGINDLKPFNNTTAFSFDLTANDFYKIQMGGKGAFSFDELKVYSYTGVPRPAAVSVNMQGKPNIGSTLTASYDYLDIMTDESEGDSISYWEIADDAAFSTVRKTENKTVKAGVSASTYTIQPTDSGKYIRFCVMPYSESGVAGKLIQSTPTVQIDVVTYNVSYNGSVSNGQFEYKPASDLYGGVVTITNTTMIEQKVVLVTEWYKNEQLFDFYTTPVSAPPGSESESGMTTVTFSNETLKIASKAAVEGVKMKVLLFDEFNLLIQSSTVTGLSNPDLPTVSSVENEYGKVYEAESAIRSGALTVRKNSGYTFSGTGFVGEFRNDTGGVDALDYFIPTETGGLYDITIMAAYPHGYKENLMTVYGEGGNSFGGENKDFMPYTLSGIYLNPGLNKITFSPDWGFFYLDCICVKEATVDFDYLDVSSELITPNVSDNTQRLMNFIVDNYGKMIITGQNDAGRSEWNGGSLGSNEFKAIKELTGEYPAMIGLDFIDYSLSRVANGAVGIDTDKAIDFWVNHGGITTFCWHWNAPKDLYVTEEQPWWRGFYTEATSFDLVAAISKQDQEGYDLLINDIDAIAAQLKKLQAQDIPVLWRPLHEASGGWFWWGASGSGPYKQLWTLMYDRLTNYHGLDNLIWVWNGQNKNWYPGDRYVDVIGEDIYASERDYGSQSSKFREIITYSNEYKLAALTENGVVPDIDLLFRDNAVWSWYTTWNGDFVVNSDGTLSEQFTEASKLSKMYSSDKSYKLSNLPDLKNYRLDLPDIVPASRIELNSSDLDLEVGDQRTLTVTVYGTDGLPMENPPIKWMSDNNNVVNVDQSGAITALKTGRVEITAKYSSSMVAAITVSVESKLSGRHSAYGMIYEAEDAAITGSGISVKTQSGLNYSGTGFVGEFANTDDSLDFYVNAGEGDYSIIVKARAQHNSQPFYLSVNDGSRADVDITKNASFTITSSSTVSLKDGINKISITPDWTHFDIDCIYIKKTDNHKSLPKNQNNEVITKNNIGDLDKIYVSIPDFQKTGIDASVGIAFYREDELISASLDNKIIMNTMRFPIEIDGVPENTTRIKIFIWNNLTEIMPVIDYCWDVDLSH